ncbi:Putative ATPase involved in DNA repair or chromosome segregation. Homolog to OMM_5 MMP and DMR_40870 of RS1 [Desulfamplus magnetovallimortis]|uniref:Putative ATPase involved in DNA repair or chromosome segregation. Homolog to OMM_5 MMP and DMR_40870 of RS1 n=2 Tax=Desulfamplus magnetovallimortis TaxID=1246637 RepID=L0R5D3_9BACT|nr:Putative ATPase involved in DNA repair or chromosome segregation. Homolog to OMM_5 MMP and DMR_40870 of RS1 [Desulfamplus magnetovallimortis BW-1]SLM32776.1 Putative ATPase involved in DNA repair or chromosome segregation. Homolog to OMM_5 MMP and DMR_40870 of RS1 [Desulfamplus magnetovallimortis]
MTHPVSENNSVQTRGPEAEADIKTETEFLQNELDNLTKGLREQGKQREDKGASAGDSAAKVNETIDEILLPELQGLEILKEGTYVIDPEKTISNMVTVVKKMESQLQSALLLNSDLEKDLDDSKVMIIDLRAEKSELEAIIKRMGDEIPSKRELQMEIEYLTDERNSAQIKIRDLKQTIEKMKQQLASYKEKITDLEEDKKDYRVEADYLVTKLNAALDKNKLHMDEIKELSQEKRAAVEKIRMLEQELRKADEERYRIYKERAK